MIKKSLPLTLYQTLEQHAQSADIDNDEELQSIMLKLQDLGAKVEAVKEQARLRKLQSNVVYFPNAK